MTKRGVIVTVAEAFRQSGPPNGWKWRCARCGTVIDGPLTDDSTCKCGDIYLQDWELCTEEKLGEIEDS